ncbi:hypothetical protein JCM16418A_12800 [Paenibacillus pini]|uniref:ABC transporter n=1 Tax=Paenibacillus pini JCM 16418 TaxID=1236976 RepID=W7YSU9_9BACL|nr:ABC transporter [Paenibacillus pini JCM 16418]
MKEETKAGNWRPFLRLIRQTKPSRGLLAIALSLGIISTLVSLVVPLLTKNLVDDFSLSSY